MMARAAATVATDTTSRERDEMQVHGRTAVVIGGAGGVGRGVCLGLARAGATVLVADLDGGAADAVADELRALGSAASAAAVDATDTGSLVALAATARERHGDLHVLVNLVGVIADRRLDEAGEDDWAWFVEFNLLAQVRANNAFLPHLRAHGDGGHLVNTSSMAGLVVLGPESVGGFHNGLYTTTKHALIGYCLMLRRELAPEGIGVSVLCPGLVAGNLSATSARNRPARFGGPTANPREGAAPNPAAMPSEHVGRFVVAGIEGDRAHIFTHPDAEAVVAQRNAALADDFAFFRSLG